MLTFHGIRLFGPMNQFALDRRMYPVTMYESMYGHSCKYLPSSWNGPGIFSFSSAKDNRAYVSVHSTYLILHVSLLWNSHLPYLSEPARSTSRSFPMVTTMPPELSYSPCSTMTVNTAWLLLLSCVQGHRYNVHTWYMWSKLIAGIDIVWPNPIPTRYSQVDSCAI